MSYTVSRRPFNLIYVSYGLEVIAVLGGIVSFFGMLTCMGVEGVKASSKKSKQEKKEEPIESDAMFYEGFEDIPNPFEETKKIKDPTLALAEEMDDEKDRMDV